MCRPYWRIKIDSSDTEEILKDIKILQSLDQSKVSKKLKDSFQKEFNRIMIIKENF